MRKYFVFSDKTPPAVVLFIRSASESRKKGRDPVGDDPIINGTTAIPMPETAGTAEAEFHNIYTRNVARVYRLCLLRLGHREDAEDACQNIFIRWLRSGKRFASEEHEKAYFLRAACNESINMRKSIRRTRHVDWEDVPETETAVCDALPDDGASVLDLLPPRYRIVLYLFYYEDMTTAEIAKLLSRNESTVRTQLQTGRSRLRMLLLKDEDSMQNK